MNVFSFSFQVINLLDVFSPCLSFDTFTDVYFVSDLMGADLNTVNKCQKLSDEHVKFLVYQILRGLKVRQCSLVVISFWKQIFRWKKNAFPLWSFCSCFFKKYPGQGFPVLKQCIKWLFRARQDRAVETIHCQLMWCYRIGIAVASGRGYD